MTARLSKKPIKNTGGKKLTSGWNINEGSEDNSTTVDNFLRFKSLFKTKNEK